MKKVRTSGRALNGQKVSPEGAETIVCSRRTCTNMTKVSSAGRFGFELGVFAFCATPSNA